MRCLGLISWGLRWLIERAAWAECSHHCDREPAWAGADLKVPRRCMGRLRGFGSNRGCAFLCAGPNGTLEDLCDRSYRTANAPALVRLPWKIQAKSMPSATNARRNQVSSGRDA